MAQTKHIIKISWLFIALLVTLAPVNYLLLSQPNHSPLTPIIFVLSGTVLTLCGMITHWEIKEYLAAKAKKDGE